jgi:hypothetical protein
MFFSKSTTAWNPCGHVNKAGLFEEGISDKRALIMSLIINMWIQGH